MLDHNSGEYIDLGNFELYFEIAMTRWDTTQRNSITNFIIVEDIGSVTQINNGFVVSYIEFKSLSDKHLRYGLIPTIAGKYSGGVEFPFEFHEKEELTSQNPERFRLINSNCTGSGQGFGSNGNRLFTLIFYAFWQRIFFYTAQI